MKTISKPVLRRFNFFAIPLFYFLFLFSSFNSFSQEQRENKYGKSSKEAIAELNLFFENDKLKLQSKLEMIEDYEKAGRFVLTVNQYEPIKRKIDSLKNSQNLPEKEYALLKMEVEKLYENYVSISDLLK